MKRTAAKRSAAEFVPPVQDYDALRAASMHCEGCDLYKHATQTVFGEGSTDARIVLVGEQPGGQEDKQGRPFVGPAGRILTEALEAAKISRDNVYVTNAVKHFKFTQRGTRRLHSKPSAREMAACRPWIEAELGLIEPEALVCLGATAAQSLIGRDFRITRQRGEWVQTEFCDHTLATWHPSAILRAPDRDRADEMRKELVKDLRKAAKAG
jgi:DNA polymerase